jgi:hypothetical protein
MAPKFTGTLAVDEVAACIMAKSADQQIIVGPLITIMTDSSAPPIPYVMVCTGDADEQMHCDQIICHDEAGRSALMLALCNHRPVIIHNMDDELDMVKWCDTLWPGDKTRRLISAVETEHGGVVKP